MRSFSEILDRLGLTAAATALNLPFTTIASWKARDSIPGAYWLPLADLAREQRVPGVTLQTLAEIASKSGARPRSAGRRVRAA